MQIAHKFDEEYRWIPGEEINIFPNADGIYELPENYTFKELPQPNWKPKFNGEDWIETITDEELEAIKNPPIPKTEIELLQEKNIELENALMELSEVSSFQEKRNVELEKALLEMTEIAADNSIKVSENEKGILETTMLVGGIINV
ncbi:hypothetical protein P4597_27010 [Peribacillus simplex]|uniref:hypothetical protein n=1 Tax=Peribacillus simplex TaxID=1478 RepID=UPI002E1C6149|nr:hypothetical protein [Peribacillus simplex]